MPLPLRDSRRSSLEMQNQKRARVQRKCECTMLPRRSAPAWVVVPEIPSLVPRAGRRQP